MSGTMARMRRQLEQVAAEGDADALCALSVMHCDGIGGPVDFVEARRLLEQAAAKGHALAHGALATLLSPPSGDAVGALSPPSAGDTVASSAAAIYCLR